MPPFGEDDSLTGLLFRCAHAMRHSDGSGGSQERVLRILARWDGLSQRALQAELGVQPGSLSELISKLEAKGLLTRQPDGEDRRRVVLHLTEAGREAAEALPEPGTRDSRFAALTQEEQDTLRALLLKLIGGAEPETEQETE
ncbi:MAG: MarR family transcriptional regulator [Clostridia bacterium]|nr:MarR family transcriptional regulator [Clostridia bacterium]